MIRMADTYYEEDNMEKAYILYFKYVTLFVEKIPKHPEYRSAEIAKEKGRAMKTLKNVMPKCEEIKKLIRSQYNEEYQVYLAHVEEEKKIEAERKIQEDKRRHHEERETKEKVRRKEN